MRSVCIMSCCAVFTIVFISASTGEVPEAYTWGLSEIYKPGGTCEAVSHLSRNSR